MLFVSGCFAGLVNVFCCFAVCWVVSFWVLRCLYDVVCVIVWFGLGLCLLSLCLVCLVFIWVYFVACCYAGCYLRVFEFGFIIWFFTCCLNLGFDFVDGMWVGWVSIVWFVFIVVVGYVGFLFSDLLGVCGLMCVCGMFGCCFVCVLA